MNAVRTFQMLFYPALIAACAAVAVVILHAANSGPLPLIGEFAQPSDTPQALIRRLVGWWNVQQRVWSGANAKPVILPPAVAQRRLVGGALLEEVMGPATQSSQEPFTRVACLVYHSSSHRYEWLSLDSRLPRMALEESYGQSQPRASASQPYRLVFAQGPAPASGSFRERRVIEVAANRQVVREYRTPLSGNERTEFLSAEYVYTRANRGY